MVIQGDDMRIPQNTIEEIKQQSDILDIVSEYVKLEKEGAIISVCVLFMMRRLHRSLFLKISKFVIALGVKRRQCLSVYSRN